MQTNTRPTGGNSTQFDDVKDGRTHTSGQPIAQESPKRAFSQPKEQFGQPNASAAPAKARRPSTAHLLTAHSAAGEAGSAAATGPGTENQPVWNKSPADTQKDLAQAAQTAKDRIDADVAKVWQGQIKDIRAWREKNVGNEGAEDIARQLFKDSEAYMLLAQDAQSRKDNIDAQVKAFQPNLDANAAAVASNSGNSDKTGELMKERQTNLENAIADIDDQANLFSTLSDKTVNNMRVGTDKQPERDFVSKRRQKRDANDGSASLALANIEQTAQQIQRSASSVAAAEHAAQTNEMPRIDNHREREVAYCKELIETARGLNGQLQNLSENETTLKLLGNKSWNVPGAAQSLTAANVVGLGLSVKKFADEVSDYKEKSRQGSLTNDDRFKMAQSSMHLIGSMAPYIPAIGPVLTPFLTVANMTLDLIGENKHTPVQNVYSQMQSQSTRSIFSRNYSSISAPRL